MKAETLGRLSRARGRWVNPNLTTGSDPVLHLEKAMSWISFGLILVGALVVLAISEVVYRAAKRRQFDDDGG